MQANLPVVVNSSAVELIDLTVPAVESDDALSDGVGEAAVAHARRRRLEQVLADVEAVHVAHLREKIIISRH